MMAVHTRVANRDNKLKKYSVSIFQYTKPKAMYQTSSISLDPIQIHASRLETKEREFVYHFCFYF